MGPSARTPGVTNHTHTGGSRRWSCRVVTRLVGSSSHFRHRLRRPALAPLENGLSRHNFSRVPSTSGARAYNYCAVPVNYLLSKGMRQGGCKVDPGGDLEIWACGRHGVDLVLRERGPWLDAQQCSAAKPICHAIMLVTPTVPTPVFNGRGGYPLLACSCCCLAKSPKNSAGGRSAE